MRTGTIEQLSAALRSPLTRGFGILLALLLVGYAFGGRGFAHHTGIHPVYLSELLLLAGAVLIMLAFPWRPPHWLWTLTAIFVIYTGLLAAVDMLDHGIPALRDAVIGLYAVFALAVGLLLSRAHVERITSAYKWIIPVFLVWTPLAALIRRSFQDMVPQLPWAEVGIVYFKAGDFAVHLTGIAAIVILGFVTWTKDRLPLHWLVTFWAVWAFAVFFVLNSRAAMLTILFGVAMAQMLLIVRSRQLADRLAMISLPWTMVTVILTLTVLFNIQMETSNGLVKIDGVYVLNGLTSLAGVTFVDEASPEEPSDEPASKSSDETSRSDQTTNSDTASNISNTSESPTADRNSDIEDDDRRAIDRTSQRQLNTREWRLDWWREITDYTVDGEYFWTGKAFGVNLADSDGFQVDTDPPLRSPHNIHMTVLARMGVPGLLLWIALQAAFAITLFASFVRSSRKDADARLTLAAGVVLVYWVAVMVNSSFDVYLEGPQGGIWFWSVFGAGLALVSLLSAKPTHTEEGTADR